LTEYFLYAILDSDIRSESDFRFRQPAETRCFEANASMC